MTISGKFLSRHKAVAIKKNIYTFGAITAAIVALMAAARIMALVTKSLLAVLALFVAVSYVTMRKRGDHTLASAARPA